MTCKKILIDARSLKENPVGIARYLVSISNILLSMGYSLVLVSNRSIIIPESLKSINVECHEFKWLCWLPGSFFISILGLFYSSKYYIFWGVNHVIPLFGVRSVLTIHDIVMIKYPKTMTKVNFISNIIFLKLSLRFADVITTVSDFTKNEVILNCRVKKEIFVIRNSVDKKIFGINKDIKHKNNFILSVGTLEPRKNLAILFSSYLSLVSKNAYTGNLVVVGKSGWKINDFIDDDLISKIGDKISFTGFVSDSELARLYNSCDLFVFPSLYEGFGIPPLEAHCCGARVLTSIYSEIPWLNLNNTYYFDPLIDSLEEKILQVVNSNDIHLSPNYKGSWFESAKKLSCLLETLS